MYIIRTSKNYAAGWLALCVHLKRKIVGGKKKENAISAVFIDKSFNVVISFCASFARRCVMRYNGVDVGGGRYTSQV